MKFPVRGAKPGILDLLIAAPSLFKPLLRTRCSGGE
jgi:hypothetical protein